MSRSISEVGKEGAGCFGVGEDWSYLWTSFIPMKVSLFWHFPRSYEITSSNFWMAYLDNFFFCVFLLFCVWIWVSFARYRPWCRTCHSQKHTHTPNIQFSFHTHLQPETLYRTHEWHASREKRSWNTTFNSMFLCKWKKYSALMTHKIINIII